MIEFFKNSGIPSAIATCSFKKTNTKHVLGTQKTNKHIFKGLVLGLNFEINYHGVEASSIVVGGDEDVVGAPGPIPKRVFGGDEFDRRGY
jgi:hypothetical protein